jgi:cobalt-zinc-cadmium resistance protein CzcA
MIDAIVRFSLSQRGLTLAAALLLAVVGWIAFRGLPIDAFPDISPTQVKIIVKAPGMTPEEVEARITTPIELEILGVPRSTMLRSVSKYALADVTLDFAEGTDIYWARAQVNERLRNVWDKLPPGTAGGVAPITTPLSEMFMFTVEGEGLSLAERRSLLDWVIRPALRTVPGVADVNALGGEVRTFEVVPDDARLAARGVSLEALMHQLETNNRNDGAGRMNVGEEAMLVRAQGQIRTLDDVRRIVVAVQGGVPIAVGDVAEARIGSLTRYGAVTQNGIGEAVQGLVLGLRGANAREVVQGVERRLAELAPSLPPGVTVSVFYNRAQLIDRAVGTVSWALLEAVVLVVLLLVAFLGDLRAAVTVAVALPLAALTTFILMHVFDMSANLMSLGGLAIAIGMLVDAAVVVVENIVRQLEHAGPEARVSRLHLVYRAVREVARPVASGILIIIIVFLPLLTLEGLEGKLFRPVALTIVFALAGSLCVSLSVIPVVASLLLSRKARGEPWLARKLAALYRPLLRSALAHSRIIVILAGVLLLATAGLYLRLGKTFLPTLDEGDVLVQLEALPSINLAQSTRLNLDVQKRLLAEVPEIERIVARSGSDEIGLDPMGLNETDVFLVLEPHDRWQARDKQALIERIRAALAALPGFNFGFTQPIEMRVAEMLTGVRGDLAIKVFGPELAEIDRLSRAVEKSVAGIAGAADVLRTQNSGMQYLSLAIDRTAAGRYDLAVDDVAKILRAQVEGATLGIVPEGIQRTPLVVRAATGFRDDPSRFEAQRIALPDGKLVPLASVARLERQDGVVYVLREKGSRYMVVRVNVAGRDLVGFVAEAKRRVGVDVTLPPGYRLEWGGQFENQQRAAARLAVVVPIALGLIFVVLFTTFRSVSQSLLVIAMVPFAMIGGVFALWLFGEYVSVPASVGFIALLGIAVLNGVVLLSHYNQLAAQGMPPGELVVAGALHRLRPVLMTASIAAFGLVPLLFATGPGSEIQRPLAIVVIGGLVTSTALTLLLMPILYRRFGTVCPPEPPR